MVLIFPPIPMAWMLCVHAERVYSLLSDIMVSMQGLVGECSMLGTKDYASHCVVYDAVM
jgi:hypothetical protein